MQVNPPPPPNQGPGVPGQPTFGFPCSPLGLGTPIGPIPEYGVPQNVTYQNTSILANHGPGQIILNPTCTNP